VFMLINDLVEEGDICVFPSVNECYNCCTSIFLQLRQFSKPDARRFVNARIEIVLLTLCLSQSYNPFRQRHNCCD
jgi:hypothetical protein